MNESDEAFVPLKSKMGSGLICGKLHDVIVTEFQDKYFILVSNNGKIGTLVQISLEMNDMKNLTSLCSKVLFGKDEPDVCGLAQSIVEVLNIKKTVLFGFSMKECNSTTAVEMRQLIEKTLLMNNEENVSKHNRAL